MSESQLRNDLFQKLSNLANHETISGSNSWATGEGIYKCLRTIFRDDEDTYILNPEMSSIFTPADKYNNQGCINYIDAISKCLSGSRELRYPVIAIWNAFRSTPQGNIDPNRIIGNHWETLVILPKYFRPLYNQALNNKTEIVFFKNSNGRGQLSDYFVYLLKNPIKVPLNLNLIEDASEGTQTKDIGGICKEPLIYYEDYKNIIQQKNSSDCGWWAVYNACMLVFTGDPSFITDTCIKEDTGLKIRKIFEDLGLDLALGETKNQSEREREIQNSKSGSMPKQFAQTNEIVNFRMNNLNEIKNMPSRDFALLVLNNDLFVDKTEFIKNIIDCVYYPFLTRPRKWGKSVTADMLRTFFQPEVDEEGNFNLDNPNRYYSLFAGGDYTNSKNQVKKLNKLKIATFNGGQYLTLEGKYPVIFITMPSYSIAIYNEEAGSDQCLRDSISNAYQEHNYIIKSLMRKMQNEKSHILKEEFKYKIELFTSYCRGDISANLYMSILTLMEMIYQHFNKRVYVIVDEVDAPVNGLYGNIEELQTIIAIMKRMFEVAFKNNNPYLQKAIFIGMVPFSIEDISSGLDNFIYNGVLDEEFTNSFGFTEEEVDVLLEKVINSEDVQSKKESVKAWYNGYKIDDLTLYNPWSMISCLNSIKTKTKNFLQSYWSKSSNPKILHLAFQKLASKNFLSKLIKNEEVEITGLNNKLFDHRISTPNNFLLLLLNSGYLTFKTQTTLAVPNQEVREYFYEDLLGFWLEKHIENFNIETYLKSLSDSLDKLGCYQSNIENNLLDSFMQGNATEADLNLWLGGFAAVASKIPKIRRHIVYAEMTNKFNFRPDNIFFPIQDKSDVVVIHEYKLLTAKERFIENLLEDAIWQVYVNQYMEVPLSKSTESEYSFWKFILVRVMVFYKDSISGKWKARVKEFKHNFEQAKQISDIFLERDRILSNAKILIGRENENIKDNERENFMAEHGRGYRNIEALLFGHSERDEISEIGTVNDENPYKIQKTETSNETNRQTRRKCSNNPEKMIPEADDRARRKEKRSQKQNTLETDNKMTKHGTKPTNKAETKGKKKSDSGKKFKRA